MKWYFNSIFIIIFLTTLMNIKASFVSQINFDSLNNVQLVNYQAATPYCFTANYQSSNTSNYFTACNPNNKFQRFSFIKIDIHKYRIVLHFYEEYIRNYEYDFYLSYSNKDNKLSYDFFIFTVEDEAMVISANGLCLSYYSNSNKLDYFLKTCEIEPANNNIKFTPILYGI